MAGEALPSDCLKNRGIQLNDHLSPYTDNFDCLLLSIQFNSYGKFGNVEISQLLSDIFGCDVPVETDGKINNWIESFLMKRKQVVIEGECSDFCSFDSGVPQGTVLGPLLFLCHINNLSTCIKSKVRLFADDCLLYTTVKTIKDQIQLQEDLKSQTNGG